MFLRVLALQQQQQAGSEPNVHLDDEWCPNVSVNTNINILLCGIILARGEEVINKQKIKL